MTIKTLAKEILANLDVRGEPEEVDRLLIPPEFLHRMKGDYRPESFFHLKRDILGTYHSMRSPGVITLHYRPLNAFFYHLVDELQSTRIYFTHEDLQKLTELVVSKTYYHEDFHYFCDIQRHLFLTMHPYSPTEEALAVAHSYQKITAERTGHFTKILARIPGVLYRVSMRWMYRYTSPGYGDWRDYLTKEDFLTGLEQLVNPPHLAKLTANQVDVGGLLFGQLDAIHTSPPVERID